ncbi:AAA family ATPase [Bacteroides reticulotermitis]|uniref:ABC transport protein n=2 Tax=Bacteroides reticulotermitis TaxID=1133319 RepID=W4US60_9BACE|nr:AAA family ATPase [Bacteroides reticulotermitis]MBB4043926.1 putative ATPase [Bacteroides reticulotermitis]GAE83443.1 ABC transport protein [Bacteroides reticulotermitis JCM 10512]
MITKLGIKGFKSIKDQVVDLAPINIMIGGNGIGKSNFIASFTFIRNLYEQNLQNYVLAEGGAGRLLYMGKKETDSISFDLFFAERNRNEHNRFIVVLKEAHDTLFIEHIETSLFNSSQFDMHLYDTNQKESSFKATNKVQTYYISRILSDLDVYHLHDTGDRSPMKGNCNINDNVSLRSNGANLAAFLYYLKEKYPKHFARIERTVASVSPFFAGFNLAPNRLNEEVIQLEWKQKGARDNYFNAYQLSDGTLRFICLVTLLLQPTPPQTIIIDEPELGLHPIAIRKLSDLIIQASEKSQIIISTQSVNLVDNFRPEDILVVDRKDNAAVFQRQDTESLSRWLEDYSLGEIWEKNIIGGQPLN